MINLVNLEARARGLKTFKSGFSQKSSTTASLDEIGSFTAGLFCLERFPALTIGPEFLLREGSDNDQPVSLPSSPPAMKLNN